MADDDTLLTSYWPPMKDQERAPPPSPVYEPASRPGGPPPLPPINARADPAAEAQRIAEERLRADEETAQRVRQRNEEAMRLARQPTLQPALPQYRNVPDPERTALRSGFEAFKSPAIFLALMGSLAARKPMLGAMQAATGVLEGFHTGDKERVERERQIWKDQTEAAVKQNDIELSKYNAVLSNSKLTAADKIAQINALASASRDEISLAQLRDGGYGNLANLYNDRAKANEKIKEALVKVGSGGSLSPEAIDAAAERYLKTGQLPPNLGRGIQGRQDMAAIQNRAAALAHERGIDVADLPKNWQKFKASQVAIQRFESGPQGNIARSLNVAIDHLSTVDELAKALKNKDFTVFNAIAQTVAEKTGSPIPTNLDAAKSIVGPEIIKAIGISGAGTGTERMHAADMWNRARSPEQLAQATETIKKLLAGQLRGLRQQYIKATGLPEKDFDEMMLPETLQQLKGLGGKPAAAPAAAGAVPDGWSIKEVK